MKRLISALVALAMILSMVPAVFATESDTPSMLSVGENVLTLDGSEEDGKSWTYTATEAGTLTLSLEGVVMPSLETGEGMEPLDPSMWETALSWFFMLSVTKNGSKVSGESFDSYVLDVAAGDAVAVTIIAGGYPGEFTWNLAFEASEVEVEITGDGSYYDPYILPGMGSYEFTNTSSTYWSYTTPVSGKLTVTMTGDTWYYFNLENKTSGSNSGYLYARDGVNTYTIDMYAGDSLTGVISPATGEETVSFTLSFEECEVDQAVSIKANWSFTGAEVTVEPGSRLKCMVSFSNNDASLYVKGENFYVVIDDVTYYPDDSGKLVLPFESDYSAVHTVYLYNTGDEAATYTFGVDYALGTQNNPEDLTNTDLGDFTCTMPESGYYYGWTAPESGKFTITMLDEENWVYTIENLTTGEYYSYPTMNWVTYEEERIPTVTLEVSEGDVIRIKLEREDWTAGQLNFNLTFVACAIEKFVPMTADPDELPLTSVVVAPGASIRYDINSWLDGGKLTISGENFYVVVGGTGVYNAETGLFMPEGGTKYEPVDGVVKISLPDYEETVVHIVNTGEEAATYVFGCEYPTGTRVNPDVIETSGSVTLEENSNPYYFAYKAIGNGYINVTVLAEMGLFYNIYTVPSDPDVEGSYSSETTVEDASEGIVFSIPVYEGDLVYIVVNNWDVDDSIPGGQIDVSVEFVEVEHAGTIGCDWSGDVYVDDDNVFEIPANSDVLYKLNGFTEGKAVLSGENFYVVINGETLYPVDGSVVIPLGNIMVHIFNTSDEEISLTATIEFPLGSYDNPGELTLGEHSVEIPMYSFYFWIYEAPADGILTLNMNGNDWEVIEWNSYIGFSSAYGDTAAVYEVYEGDVLVIRMNTVMGNAATMSFTASFAEAGAGDGGEQEYLGDGEELTLGDNFVEVEADSEYGSEWYFIPEITGNLTLSVTDLQSFFEGEWGPLALRALGTGSLSSSVILTVNGEQVSYDMGSETASITIGVVAGSPVFITMESANGTALRATLNLAVASNVHDANDGILLDGVNEFDVVLGNTELIYNATANGTLTIEILGGVMYDDWFGEYSTVYPSDLAGGFAFGMFSLTVNGELVNFEEAMEDYNHPIYYNILLQMDVKAGDEVVLGIGNEQFPELSMTVDVSFEEGEAGPNVIDELPAELIANFATTEDAYDVGATWLYTATQDGKLEFLAASEGLMIMVFVNGEWVYGYEFGEAYGEAIVAEGDEVEILLYAENAGTYSCIVTYADPEPEATVTVETVTAAPGETVTLKVFITAVQYASYQLVVNYDGSLTLVNIEAGDETLGAFTGNPENGIVLDYATVDTNVDGVIFTLTFEVAKDAEAGLHEVGLELHGFFDANGEEVVVDVVSGGVEVHEHVAAKPVEENRHFENGCCYVDYVVYCSECGAELSRETVKLYTLGNVNGDDEIDVRDAMVVAQYIVGDITGEQLDVDACDVNGDKEIDVRDAMLIAQLIVGDITVFPAEANQ